MKKEDLLRSMELFTQNSEQETQMDVKVIHKTEEEELRKFWAVVLEPETDVADDGVGDAHGHVMSVEEVEKAAHYYMENGANVYKSHSAPVDASVVESFIAPCDYTMNEQTIKKGSWVMCVKVHDDELWKEIKDGEIMAFSPGGKAFLTDLQ
jgi:hypothetical protein